MAVFISLLFHLLSSHSFLSTWLLIILNFCSCLLPEVRDQVSFCHNREYLQVIRVSEDFFYQCFVSSLSEYVLFFVFKLNVSYSRYPVSFCCSSSMPSRAVSHQTSLFLYWHKLWWVSKCKHNQPSSTSWYRAEFLKLWVVTHQWFLGSNSIGCSLSGNAM
jgi:hypothetical protein